MAKWRVLKNYPDYRRSDCGRVSNWKTGVELRPLARGLYEIEGETVAIGKEPVFEPGQTAAIKSEPKVVKSEPKKKPKKKVVKKIVRKPNKVAKNGQTKPSKQVFTETSIEEIRAKLTSAVTTEDLPDGDMKDYVKAAKKKPKKKVVKKKAGLGDALKAIKAAKKATKKKKAKKKAEKKAVKKVVKKKKK